jgi:membrane-associated phospholipid phosphatase
LIAAFCLVATRAFGQDAEGPVPAPVSGPVSAPVSAPADAFDRPVSWGKLVPNILDDQKRMWLSPLKLRHKEALIATGSVIGVTVGLVALDPKVANYFRGTASFSGFNSVFNDRATAIGTAAIPASLYLIGLGRKDSKMQHTALLAGEAVADGEILTNVLKRIGHRTRPGLIPVGGNFSDTWFEDPDSSAGSSGSFPSGHAVAAFSVATVVARRYGNHRWVPYAAYGLAAVVGFSRVTRSAHYVSDVFMGSALGYAIGRFTVLQQ